MKGTHPIAGETTMRKTNQADIARKIESALNGDTSAKTIRRVRELLGKLTIAQIHDIKRQHHAKASGRTKAELIGKVAERIVKEQTIPVSAPQAEKPCIYTVMGIKKDIAPESNLRVSETRYIEMLLTAINNVTNTFQPICRTWAELEHHWSHIRSIIRNESFAHDYGTMSEKDVRKLVKKLRGIYYIPATRYQAV